MKGRLKKEDNKEQSTQEMEEEEGRRRRKKRRREVDDDGHHGHSMSRRLGNQAIKIRCIRRWSWTTARGILLSWNETVALTPYLF
jgi:hypothetical protein